MKEVKSFEDVLKTIEEGCAVSVDLSNLNDIDYTKSIDYIKQMNIVFKKITRSKFMFISE